MCALPIYVAIGATANALPFTIAFAERLGGLATLHLEGPGGVLTCQIRDDGSLNAGDAVPVTLPPAGLPLFDAAGKRRGRDERGVGKARGRRFVSRGWRYK